MRHSIGACTSAPQASNMPIGGARCAPVFLCPTYVSAWYLHGQKVCQHGQARPGIYPHNPFGGVHNQPTYPHTQMGMLVIHAHTHLGVWVNRGLIHTPIWVCGHTPFRVPPIGCTRTYPFGYPQSGTPFRVPPIGWVFSHPIGYPRLGSTVSKSPINSIASILKVNRIQI